MNRIPLFGALSLALPIACADAQNIVYEAPERALNTNTPYFGITEGTEYADLAGLGGTDRFVTEASLRVRSESRQTGDVTFSLYEAVGQGGLITDLSDLRPGTTPLASVTLTDVTFNAATDLGSGTELIFSGIDTLVEDQVFWAVRFENVEPLNEPGPFGIFFGLADNLTPAGAATDPTQFFGRNTDSGPFISIPFDDSRIPDNTFAVRITAIPEPTSAALVLIGLAGFLCRRRRG